jgi:hypothetical protein
MMATQLALSSSSWGDTLVRSVHDLLKYLSSFADTLDIITAVRRQRGQGQTQARERNDQEML